MRCWPALRVGSRLGVGIKFHLERFEDAFEQTELRAEMVEQRANRDPGRRRNLTRGCRGIPLARKQIRSCGKDIGACLCRVAGVTLWYRPSPTIRLTFCIA